MLNVVVVVDVDVVVVVVVVVVVIFLLLSLCCCTHQGSASLPSFPAAEAWAALMSREASLSLMEETMDSQRLRPIDGVLNESMNEEPKSPIVISFRNGLEWGVHGLLRRFLAKYLGPHAFVRV